MKFLATMAVLLPGAALAQDLQFSIADTQYCLDRAGTYVEMESCVGSSAGACMSANDLGGTTVGMVGCMDYELGYWDDRLNAVYKELRARERAEDEEYGSTPGAINQAEALRDMQRAWIAFRDTTCAFEYAQWGGGTGGGPASVGCHMEMTGAQAIYLERMLDNY